MKKYIKIILLLAFAVFSNSAIAQYCTPATQSTCCMGIRNVQINTINNYTGNNSSYTNTNISTDLIPGNTYSITIQGYSYQQYASVWIDYNGNNVFDTNERVVSQLYLNYTGTANFTIPTSGITASVTKMRIKTDYQYNHNNYSYLDPCANPRYGETEDYTVRFSVPFVITKNITVQLDVNGNASITPQDVDNGSYDSDGPVTLSIDKTNFNCDDLGGNSTEVSPTFAGQVNQNTHSYGGGYNPNTKEYWYPQWNNNTINVYNEQHQFIRTFNNNQNSIMQIWADTDDANAYYSTNFYGPTISKNLISGGVEWTINTGLPYASGVTTDEQYVYTFGYSSNLIKVYNKANGQFVKQYTMPGTIYGYSTIVAANEFLYVGGQANGWSSQSNNWAAIHKFNKNNGTYIESISTSGIRPYSCAFDGETMWISNNSNTLYGYKISDGNAYGNGGSGSNAVILTVTDPLGYSNCGTAIVTVEDNIAPTISLNGDASVNVTIGETFTDPEATVADNCTAELEITGTVDINTLGEYSLTYKAIDGSGNESEPVTRTVNVVGPAEALAFDGANDYVALNMFESGASSLPEFTVEAWVNTSFNVGGNFDNWSIFDFDRSEFFNVFITPMGQLGFATSAAGNGTDDMYSENELLNDGQWHHIAAVYDGQDKILYHDGEEIARVQNAHNGEALGRTAVTRYAFIGDGSEATTFNGARNNVYYDGQIDEVRYWNVGLCEEAIQSQMNNELTGSEAGLTAYYDFNQGYNGADNAGLTTLPDVSGNNHTGTLYNSTLNGDVSNWIAPGGVVTGSLNNIVVVCNVPPIAVCQAVEVSADANCEGTAVAADFDGGSSDPDGDEITFSISPAGPYAIGETEVTLTVSDPSGETSTCLTTITVTDNEVPVITASAAIVQTADAGVCGASITIVDATATDNCGVGSVIGTRDDGEALTALYPVGVTTITWTVTDSNDNDAVAVTQTVTISDDEVPVISASGAITQTADAGVCGASVTIVDATATDNCSVGAVTGTRDDSLALDALYPVGTTTITWTVTDINDNDAVAVTQTVTISDDEAPVISASGAISQTADAGVCGASITIVDATATDNCSVGAVTGTRDDSLVLDAIYPVGTTTITWTVTDSNDNDAVAVTQTVTISDDEAPAISCPTPDTSYSTDSGLCTASLTFDATTSDNCGVASTVYSVEGAVIGFPYPFKVGKTTVEVLVTDSHDNTNTCSFDVIVTDDEAPVLAECPGNIIQGNDAGVCEAVVTWIEPTASDNCTDTMDLVWTKSHTSGDVFPLGTTTVTYTATDLASNVSMTCSFDVTVTNTIPNSIDGVVAGIDPIQAGTGFDLSSDFADDNLTSATWYFSSDGDFTGGDTAEYSYPGTIAGGVVSGAFNFDATQAGVYTVKVVVVDACGETAEATYNYVVIYDASGGFITGGGWFMSPLGALVGTIAEGKANFGFVAKYRTGNNNSHEVDGNTNFQFKEGDFHFKSSDYEDMSLVISGERKATYRGSGTVNGSGDYDFMVTVIDGEAPGAGPYDFDSFRIKIWDGSPSNVVYDNEIGVVENADSSTALGGGSITIHKPRGNGNNRSSNEAVDAESIDSDLFEAKIWPSPSDAYFNIDLKTGNLSDMVEVQVFDLIGKLVQVDSFDARLSYKFGERLPSGIYFVRISQAYDTKTIRIIKH